MNSTFCNPIDNISDPRYFTRICRAFDKPVRILMPPGKLPFCEETCTTNGICDDRMCAWSIATAVALEVHAETKGNSLLWEKWIANLIRPTFPFAVDYTETAWDPCLDQLPVVICKGPPLSFLVPRDAVLEHDVLLAGFLRNDSVFQSLRFRELVFRDLGISGYDTDPRALPQIPEVIRWVQECEATMPDLGAWLDPNSMVWFATAVFNIERSDCKPLIPIEFYLTWVKKTVSAAFILVSQRELDNAFLQRLTTSMYHKAGWALHEGWGAWFRDVPYQVDLAKELWEDHRPLDSPENIHYDMQLIERIRRKAGTVG